MSNFWRPEYKGYIALCRELELPREWRLGDLYEGWKGNAFYLHAVQYDNEPLQRNSTSGGSSTPPVWLPSLSDWLEKLQEAGYDSIELLPYPHAGFQWMARYQRRYLGPKEGSPFETEDKWDFEQTAGVTREEAAAKLWISRHKSGV